VRGGEIAAQVLNPTQPMNELIRRATTTTAERPRADRSCDSKTTSDHRHGS
jgi:hypothetical protein